jgi:hypothetical protein
MNGSNGISFPTHLPAMQRHGIGSEMAQLHQLAFTFIELHRVISVAGSASP